MALIQITDLTFAYPGSFDNVFEHVSFQFDTDWRLGLTGRNGRGKTTLLRLLQGQYPHQGTITAPAGSSISRIRFRTHRLRRWNCWSAASRMCRNGVSGRNWLRSRSQRTHCTARFPRFPAGSRQSFCWRCCSRGRAGICSSTSQRIIWTRRAARSSAGIWQKSPVFCSSRMTARF